VKTWVKLYTKLIDDPDIALLSWAERGIWTSILALAGKLDERDTEDRETGQLDTPERVAWYLRIAIDELQAALASFTRLGMVEERGGVLFIPKYPKRQATPPSERNEAVRQRVRSHRQHVTPPAPDVTPLHASGNEPVTHLDKSRVDTDSEQKRGEGEVEQPRASAPTPPPIVIFRELTHSCPAPGTPMWDAIASLPAANGHMDTWRQVIQEWMLRGFKTRNIAGMLDWYHNGIPPRGPTVTAGPRARAAPRGPDPDLHAAAIAGERYRAQLEEQHDHPA